MTKGDMAVVLFRAVLKYNALLKEHDCVMRELKRGREVLVGILQCSIDASVDPQAMYDYVMAQPIAFAGAPECQIPQHILDALHV